MAGNVNNTRTKGARKLKEHIDASDTTQFMILAALPQTTAKDKRGIASDTPRSHQYEQVSCKGAN